MATNEQILTELRAVHSELIDHKKSTEPLIQIAPDLKSMAELYHAGKVGGSAVKWVVTLGTGIIALIALVKVALGGIVHWVSP